jgi:succinate dehydrogenase/fumarate reductase flavoprotein subunit
MCMDALNRNESCGGHFREEFQTEEGEALRDDENYSYVAAWEMKEVGKLGVTQRRVESTRILRLLRVLISRIKPNLCFDKPVCR